MLIEMQHDRKDFTRDTAYPPFLAEPLVPDHRSKSRCDGVPARGQVQPLGEIAFDAAETGIIVKWIKTDEPLPVQIHPQRGVSRKHKWWYIADVGPGAYFHLGLKQTATCDEIREAALSGRLTDLLRRIEPAIGDMFYVEAGTIHALGPGLTLIEIQESPGTTLQLSPDGGSHDLHLDQALEEMTLNPQPIMPFPGEAAPFRIVQEMLAPEQRVMLMDPLACVTVVEGSGTFGNYTYGPGQCWRLNGPLPVRATEATMLIVAEPHVPTTDSDNLWRARH
ncbi:class I mannose-6-phosphate isomerase [Paracoccus pantotrophus]|uniref:Class I mannose-6-phosphate isomerase n=1 Tax=Paracoccus pantotrophus TaxID=82367 RepID=A0A7H9BXI1_PARPN|nr:MULTISPECIES: class I mannose-6-phosphate isomerase [Paracoccus]QLH16107.1 class I mannose-6-phosphate isomerase [Paracoccus pantotrophus]UFM65951.1 class I mannose-6-phosphate isomerase [Paracoccus sp. MA]